jgi:hypothetical protein
LRRFHRLADLGALGAHFGQPALDGYPGAGKEGHIGPEIPDRFLRQAAARGETLAVELTPSHHHPVRRYLGEQVSHGQAVRDHAQVVETGHVLGQEHT